MTGPEAYGAGGLVSGGMGFMRTKKEGRSCVCMRCLGDLMLPKNLRVQTLAGMVGRRGGSFRSLEEMLALDVMALLSGERLFEGVESFVWRERSAKRKAQFNFIIISFETHP